MENSDKVARRLMAAKSKVDDALSSIDTADENTDWAHVSEAISEAQVNIEVAASMVTE